MPESNSNHRASGEPMKLNPLELNLDPKNPRLRREEQGTGQERLLEIMIERFKLEELGESIVTSGFVEFDPIIGCRGDEAIVVLEGNRRLAALKLLLRPELAPETKIDVWRRLSERLTHDARERLASINVLVFPDRRQGAVRAYIGFRHVTGVLQWPPLEKAGYIADLIESEGWAYSEIADRLGSYAKHVERHYIAHQVVVQALDLDIDGADKMREAFGVLMRALQAGGVREFLGIDYPGDPSESRRPVPSDKEESLRYFVKWTFGTNDTMPILRDSRQLTKWGRILSAPEAVGYLKRTPQPDFDRAWLKSGGQAESVSEALFTAADRLEESVPLVSELADDPEVTAAVRECSRFLRQILRHFPRVAEQYGFSTE